MFRQSLLNQLASRRLIYVAVILLCLIFAFLLQSAFREKLTFSFFPKAPQEGQAASIKLQLTSPEPFQNFSISSQLQFLKKVEPATTKPPPNPSEVSRNFAEKIRKYVSLDDGPGLLYDQLYKFRDRQTQNNEPLSDYLVPNVVFYVWCGRRNFEFGHYLSILSVMRHIRPDSTVFYYESYPEIDKRLYNTWFLEILESFPYFVTEEITNAAACNNKAQANETFIKHLVDTDGGIYINETTILNKFPPSCKQSTQTIFNNSDESISLFISQSRNGKKTTGNDDKSKMQADICEITCIARNVAEKVENDTSISCVQLLQSIYPRDIWTLENSFGRLARTVFYGSPEPSQAVPSNDTLVPNIAHLVWLGGGQMDFLFYLDVLSLIYVVEVDMVYIHGDGPPTGDYWNLLEDNKKIKLIYRSASKTVYGKPVGQRPHVSDAWRVDIMIKYGGIYVDTDVIFVQPLDKEIRSYDAVASYDWPHEDPFPNVINFGVTMGKRNAPFWRKFQSSMKWFIDGEWTWNGLRQPYRVFERNPQLLKMDPRLQVICFFEKCHPTWFPNYANANIHHLNSPSIKNWRKDAFSFHWTHPVPRELHNHEVLLKIKNDTLFSEIGKFILQKAGMMKHFQKTL